MTTAYVASNQLRMFGIPAVSGVIQQFSASATNVGDATYAPDGLAAAPIFGLGGQPLQGDEIAKDGNVTLVSYVGPLLNAGNLCWVLLECTGGAQQVAPATQSQHAIQFGQADALYARLNQAVGVAGQARNASMAINTASSTATFTASEVIVEAALGSSTRYALANVSVPINLASTGAGGMDSGSAPVNGFVGVYVIYNPATATSALLAVNATAGVVSEVYTGPNMPSGYVASALVAVLPVASSQFVVCQLADRRVSLIPNDKISTTTVSDQLTAFSVSAVVPFNAKKAQLGLGVVNTAANASMTIRVAANAQGVGLAQGSSTCVTPGFGHVAYAEVPLTTSQTFYRNTVYVGPGTPTFTVYVNDYTF